MDRKRQRLKRATLVYLALAIGSYAISLVFLDRNSSASGGVGMFSYGLWLLGSITLAQSKGYSQWYGALGIFCIIGTAVLFALPDNWPVEASQPSDSPTNYPRYPEQ